MSEVRVVGSVLGGAKSLFSLLLARAAFLIVIAVADLLCQALGDDKQGQVNPILKNIADDAFAVLNRGMLVAVLKHQIESAGHRIADEAAGISPDCLNALRVHLVRLVRVRVIHSRVPLLVHQQVRMIDLFELKFDRLNEELADNFSRLRSESHSLCAVVGSKQHHDGIGVSVDDVGIELERFARLFINIILVVLFDDGGLGGLDHLTTERSDTGGDGETRQLADLRTSEAIDTICADLQRQLTAVKHRLYKWIFGFLQLLFSLFTG